MSEESTSVNTMVEREIKGYFFKPLDTGEVEVYNYSGGKHNTIRIVPIKAANQKEFDKEIAWLFMDGSVFSEN